MFTSPTPSRSQYLLPIYPSIVVLTLICLGIFAVVLVMLSAHYWRDLLCFSVRCCQDPDQSPESQLQLYSSSQMLVGSPRDELTWEMVCDNMDGQLSVIGQPRAYHLQPMGVPQPRLPSYESVRKKDQQRQIHKMIADRFGLNTPVFTEAPPSYEESTRPCPAVAGELVEQHQSR